MAVPAGSTVSFPNFDPIFHNVFSLSQTQGVRSRHLQERRDARGDVRQAGHHAPRLQPAREHVGVPDRRRGAALRGDRRPAAASSSTACGPASTSCRRGPKAPASRDADDRDQIRRKHRAAQRSPRIVADARHGQIRATPWKGAVVPSRSRRPAWSPRSGCFSSDWEARRVISARRPLTSTRRFGRPARRCRRAPRRWRNFRVSAGRSRPMKTRCATSRRRSWPSGRTRASTSRSPRCGGMVARRAGCCICQSRTTWRSRLRAGTHLVVRAGQLHLVTVMSIEPRQRADELVGVLAVAKQLDTSAFGAAPRGARDQRRPAHHRGFDHARRHRSQRIGDRRNDPADPPGRRGRDDRRGKREADAMGTGRVAVRAGGRVGRRGMAVASRRRGAGRCSDRTRSPSIATAASTSTAIAIGAPAARHRHLLKARAPRCPSRRDRRGSRT